MIKPNAVNRSPGIYLTAEENSRKLQQGDRLMKAARLFIASKWGPLLPNVVGRIARHFREGEERKDGSSTCHDKLGFRI